MNFFFFCRHFYYFCYYPLALGICLIQLDVKENLTATLNHLSVLIARAMSEHRPRVIALPECFNFAYETKPSVFNKAAESIADGETCRFLSAMAKQYAVYIVGGSIIERDNDKLYNTCTVWNTNGELIARHRKVYEKHKFMKFHSRPCQTWAKHEKICLIRSQRFVLI